MNLGITRHQRWLHPRQLPYFWVGLLCLISAPAVGLALLGWFALVWASRWWHRRRGGSASEHA
ncbi:hypothetical protein KUV89_06080 [Marinobacter hydrocarbonoclasticus]|nr:hypothetical protein [Marinobacter nauticus]